MARCTESETDTKRTLSGRLQKGARYVRDAPDASPPGCVPPPGRVGVAAPPEREAASGEAWPSASGEPPGRVAEPGACRAPGQGDGEDAEAMPYGAHSGRVEARWWGSCTSAGTVPAQWLTWQFVVLHSGPPLRVQLRPQSARLNRCSVAGVITLQVTATVRCMHHTRLPASGCPLLCPGPCRNASTHLATPAPYYVPHPQAGWNAVPLFPYSDIRFATPESRLYVDMGVVYTHVQQHVWKVR